MAQKHDKRIPITGITVEARTLAAIDGLASEEDRTRVSMVRALLSRGIVATAKVTADRAVSNARKSARA